MMRIPVPVNRDVAPSRTWSGTSYRHSPRSRIKTGTGLCQKAAVGLSAVARWLP